MANQVALVSLNMKVHQKLPKRWLALTENNLMVGKYGLTFHKNRREEAIPNKVAQQASLILSSAAILVSKPKSKL